MHDRSVTTAHQKAARRNIIIFCGGLSLLLVVAVAIFTIAMT
jgi:hypothetical protein